MRERSKQQSQPLDLLGIQNTVKQIKKIRDSNQLPFRNIAEVGPGRQINRWRELGEKMLRKVELEVKTGEVPLLLLKQFLDLEIWKDHSAFRVIGVRQWEKALGK